MSYSACYSYQSINEWFSLQIKTLLHWFMIQQQKVQVVQPNQIIIMLTTHVRMTVFIVLLHWVSCTIKFLGGFGAVWINNSITLIH